jgi:hypothetical protein
VQTYPISIRKVKKKRNAKLIYEYFYFRYGKTIVYALLPEIMTLLRGQKSSVVIISPLKALMKDQVERLRDMGLSAVAVTDEENTSGQ